MPHMSTLMYYVNSPKKKKNKEGSVRIEVRGIAHLHLMHAIIHFPLTKFFTFLNFFTYFNNFLFND